MHYIRTEVVNDLILQTIRRVTGYVRNNESGFVERVREMSDLRAEEEIKESKKRLSKSERRIAEPDKLVTKLYETYALGKLPENHFERMIGEYDSEQTRLRQTIAELRSEIDGYAADSVRADKFIELVKRYTEFDVLTVRMLNEPMEKVVVFEGDRSSRKRVQKVDIYLSFIGNFDIPREPATQTPEEIEAERKAEERRRAARLLKTAGRFCLFKT